MKALKQEQRRLAQEINSLSKATGKQTKGKAAGSGSSPSKRGRKSGSSRESTSNSRSREGVEMKSYLSTGSFRGKRELRHERAVQRNKAIFMFIVACAAIYIFCMWVY